MQTFLLAEPPAMQPVFTQDEWLPQLTQLPMLQSVSTAQAASYLQSFYLPSATHGWITCTAGTDNPICIDSSALCSSLSDSTITHFTAGWFYTAIHVGYSFLTSQPSSWLSWISQHAFQCLITLWYLSRAFHYWNTFSNFSGFHDKADFLSSCSFGFRWGGWRWWGGEMRGWHRTCFQPVQLRVPRRNQLRILI